jgi:hypothetical protein
VLDFNLKKSVFVLCVCSFIGARVLQSLSAIYSCFSSRQFSSPSALADPGTAERFLLSFLFSLPQSPVILSASCFCCSAGSLPEISLACRGPHRGSVSHAAW